MGNIFWHFICFIAIVVRLTQAWYESFPSCTSSTLLNFYSGLCTTCQTSTISIHYISNERRKTIWTMKGNETFKVSKSEMEANLYLCVRPLPFILLYALSGWGIKIDSDWQPSNKWSSESISQGYLHQVHSGFIFWICCLCWLSRDFCSGIKNVKQAII